MRRWQAMWMATVLVGATAFASARPQQVAPPPDTTEPAPRDPAMRDLESLRRSADLQSDAPRVVERFRVFVERHEGTPAGDEARKDLALWQSRVADGLVRIGTKWVTPTEADAIRAEAVDLCRRAAESIRAARFADAGASIDSALERDPQSAAAYYLRGVLAVSQEQLPAARKAFDESLKLAAGHPPTLNNIAALQMRMNQQSAALNTIEKVLAAARSLLSRSQQDSPPAIARSIRELVTTIIVYKFTALNTIEKVLAAAPQERLVLDNVAELLAAVPDNLRDSAVGRRLQRKFVEQDTIMAKRLATQGQFRWGATWVDQAQLNVLRDAEKKNQDKLDELAAEYETVKRRLDNIQSEYTQNEREMRRLEARATAYDSSGNVVRLPLPAAYFDLQRDQQRLVTEQATERADGLRLQDQAKALKTAFPVPRYTGVLQLYGPEAAPVPLPPAPSAAVPPGDIHVGPAATRP